MLFKRAPQRYGDSPAPTTPYQKAAQIWDERLGTWRSQAIGWQTAAFILGGVSLILAGGSIWQATRSHITPYIVEIDRMGDARAISAAMSSYQPTDLVIARHLSDFIENLRSLSIDPMVIRANWIEAYSAVTDKSKPFLDEFATTAKPFERVGERSIAVQITSVVRATENTYQVKWTEQHFERSNMVSRENWTAMLTLVSATPKQESDILKNPLGLYVNGMAWSRDIDSTQQ